MTKYYSVSRSEGNQLVLQQVSGPDINIPPEITDFIPVIDTAARRIQQLITDTALRKNYIEAIDGAARSAFEGGNLNGAKQALQSLKDQVVAWEGPSIRKKYLQSTLLVFGLAGVLGGILALAAAYLGATACGWLSPTLGKILATAAYMLIGISLGITLLAFLRNMEMKFETLGMFDAASLNPLMRLIFVSVLAAVFAILLHQRVLVIAIGNYELNQLFDKPMVAVVVGILCGFSDIVVAKLISGMFEKTAAKS